MSEWINRDLDYIGNTDPCKCCSEPSIPIGSGYCYECYKEKLTEVILGKYPVSGKEVLEKLKKKGMDI